LSLLPDLHLKLPIRVEGGDFVSGSGFLYFNQDFVYFITAKHVLFDSLDKLRNTSVTLHGFSTAPGFGDPNEIVLELDTLF